MQEEMVHLLAGSQNCEFQLLTKFKDTFGKQGHLPKPVFYTKEHIIGKYCFLGPFTSRPASRLIPTGKLRGRIWVSSSKDAIGSKELR